MSSWENRAPALDLSNIPQFGFRANNSLGDLKNSFVQIAVMLIISIILLVVEVFISERKKVKEEWRGRF